MVYAAKFKAVPVELDKNSWIKEFDSQNLFFYFGVLRVRLKSSGLNSRPAPEFYSFEEFVSNLNSYDWNIGFNPLTEFSEEELKQWYDFKVELTSLDYNEYLEKKFNERELYFARVSDGRKVANLLSFFASFPQFKNNDILFKSHFRALLPFERQSLPGAELEKGDFIIFQLPLSSDRRIASNGTSYFYSASNFRDVYLGRVKGSEFSLIPERVHGVFQEFFSPIPESSIEEIQLLEKYSLIRGKVDSFFDRVHKNNLPSGYGRVLYSIDKFEESPVEEEGKFDRDDIQN